MWNIKKEKLNRDKKKKKNQTDTVCEELVEMSL